jgi:hypothetical protein
LIHLDKVLQQQLQGRLLIVQLESCLLAWQQLFSLVRLVILQQQLLEFVQQLVGLQQSILQFEQQPIIQFIIVR